MEKDNQKQQVCKNTKYNLREQKIIKFKTELEIIKTELEIIKTECQIIKNEIEIIKTEMQVKKK